MRLPILLLTLAAALAAQTAQTKPSPYTPVADTPGLPRVLILGDSISIGYTLPTRAALSGVANVHRAKENCGPTTVGVQNVESWLGKDKWDVIHFNFGLHDLKQMFDGYYQVSPDDYERNLRRIVFRLRQTGAKLIFATTTPVPEGKLSPPRLPADVALYNERALKVMKDNGVAVDDLFAFALPHLAEWQLPANVHFTDAGSEALGKEVARIIAGALKTPAR
ncbi:MAG TPA: SGNH/GDSL hydrolase family protein [Bryobacteraceae bacterium]|nr:SGNH/GDSL hydrolase family protein [Bryobacteraceae bacterium]